MGTRTGDPQARLRENPDFRRFWTARVVSLAGSSFTYVALPVLIYQRTGSPLLTGLVAAFEAIPYLLLGLVAGALADRWDRRRVMVAADLVSAVALGSLPIADVLGVLTVPHVLVAAFLSPTVFVFFDAANFGALPALVGRDRIASANSAIWGAGTVVEIAFPLLAGALLAVVAAPTLIGFDSLSFVASALMIRLISHPLSDPERDPEQLGLKSLAAEVREGLRFLVGHANVRTMTLVGACQSLAGGAFIGQMVVWADRRLGVRGGDVRLGVLYASWGLGALAASIVMPKLNRRYGAPRVILSALPASAALAVATALAVNWIEGAALLLAWGVAYMLVVMLSITYRMEVTPQPLMSRVNTAGRMLSFGLGWPIGSLIGGLVAQARGPAAGMLAGAGAAAVGALIAWTSPLRASARAHEARA
jgi:MFS family permease